MKERYNEEKTKGIKNQKAAASTLQSISGGVSDTAAPASGPAEVVVELTKQASGAVLAVGGALGVASGAAVTAGRASEGASGAVLATGGA